MAETGVCLAFLNPYPKEDGPYVHLEQFMELVEARALSLAERHSQATKEIKQEIEEGKI